MAAETYLPKINIIQYLIKTIAHKMKRLQLKFKQSAAFIFSLLIISILSVSCSKDEEITPEEPPVEESTGSVPFYKLQRVENLAAETDDKNPTVPKTEVLYSLENKTEQPLTFAKTSLWDLSFSGLYNSFLSGNNSANSLNTGYQGPGKGGIIVLEKSFDEVTDVPADSEFKTGKGLVGTDKAGAFGDGTGWYLYDFGGILIGDGSEQKKHVAYAAGEPLKLKDGTTLSARTIVLRTANGNIAKIKMISCYKDAFTADQWFKDTPHMYFTFEYVLVPKGSTKFEIK